MKVLDQIPMRSAYMMKAAALIRAAGLQIMPPAPGDRRGKRWGTGRCSCVFNGRKLSDSFGSDSFLFVSEGKRREITKHIAERSC